jgi:hypothetical protein
MIWSQQIFFVVPAATFRLLFVFLVLSHDASAWSTCCNGTSDG